MRASSQEAITFLRELIRIPSFSREEDGTARVILDHLVRHGIPFERKHNNVWARNRQFDPARPTILLNSHHDTVRPAAAYSMDPFTPIEVDGRLYGLGSNDAGASLVGLWATFLHFYDAKMAYNLVFAATGEEEISGANGISSILPDLGPVDFAIVGEPTGMDLAVAEKGLVVVDCTMHGTASHAAHPNDDNAILKAMEDIRRIRELSFEKVSDLLGPVKATVTVIHAGSAHNVVPDRVEFTIDVRTNEWYSNAEVVDVLRQTLSSEIRPRSLRLNSSRIPDGHPIIRAALDAGCRLFGSPTLSDQALMPFDSVKIGIGESARSHTADEYVYLEEIASGIDRYIRILTNILQPWN